MIHLISYIHENSTFDFSEGVVRRCFLFLQENTCARDSFLIKLQAPRVSFLIKLPEACNSIKKETLGAYNYIKKESLAQVFSWEFCEISKNTFFLQNTSDGYFCLFQKISLFFQTFITNKFYSTAVFSRYHTLTVMDQIKIIYIVPPSVKFSISFQWNQCLNYFTTWKGSKCEVFSGPYFPVFSPNTGKYGSEKTLYLYTFHAVFMLLFVLYLCVFVFRFSSIQKSL